MNVNDGIAHLSFVTHDHPEANGRQALSGDVGYPLRFTLEDGRILEVKMGQKGYDALCSMIRQMAVDDALDEALNRAH